MQTSHTGACHCGAVTFRVTLAGGLTSASRCDCSLCAMRGAVALTAKEGDLHILTGKDALTLYQFNTGTAKHYFCRTCGIYTHHQRRSDPGEFGVNAACLEGVSPFDFAEVPVTNGHVHSSDDPTAKVYAGTLRFEPS